MRLYSFFALVILCTGFYGVPGWTPDTNAAQVHFTIKGPFGTVNGKFTGLKATIKFSKDDLKNSSVAASIDASTVSTGTGLRNKDLRTKELWLNTGQYPRISFSSTKIEKKGNGYVATGNLTLKGKTKTIGIPFTFTGTEETGVFKGTFTINREDFDIGKKGGSVGKTVTIDLNIPVKNKG